MRAFASPLCLSARVTPDSKAYRRKKDCQHDPGTKINTAGCLIVQTLASTVEGIVHRKCPMGTAPDMRQLTGQGAQNMVAVPRA